MYYFYIKNNKKEKILSVFAYKDLKTVRFIDKVLVGFINTYFYVGMEEDLLSMKGAG